MKNFVTISKAAADLGVSANAVRIWVTGKPMFGLSPAVQVDGGAYRVDAADIEALGQMRAAVEAHMVGLRDCSHMSAAGFQSAITQALRQSGVDDVHLWLRYRNERACEEPSWVGYAQWCRVYAASWGVGEAYTASVEEGHGDKVADDVVDEDTAWDAIWTAVDALKVRANKTEEAAAIEAHQHREDFNALSKRIDDLEKQMINRSSRLTDRIKELAQRVGKHGELLANEEQMPHRVKKALDKINRKFALHEARMDKQSEGAKASVARIHALEGRIPARKPKKWWSWS